MKPMGSNALDTDAVLKPVNSILLLLYHNRRYFLFCLIMSNLITIWHHYKFPEIEGVFYIKQVDSKSLPKNINLKSFTDQKFDIQFLNSHFFRNALFNKIEEVNMKQGQDWNSKYGSEWRSKKNILHYDIFENLKIENSNSGLLIKMRDLTPSWARKKGQRLAQQIVELIYTQSVKDIQLNQNNKTNIDGSLKRDLASAKPNLSSIGEQPLYSYLRHLEPIYIKTESKQTPVSIKLPIVTFGITLLFIASFHLLRKESQRVVSQKQVEDLDLEALTSIPSYPLSSFKFNNSGLKGKIPNSITTGTKGASLPFQNLILNFQNAKLVCLVSPTSESGKTTVGINLAMQSSLQGIKTILVNTQFNDNTINDFFGIQECRGLFDSIDNLNTLSSDINRDVFHNLDFLSSGIGRLNRPIINELLLIKKVFQKLSEDYELIIIDTPYFFTDVLPLQLAKLSDLTLVVVKENETKWEDLYDLQIQLKRSQDTKFKAIINCHSTSEQRIFKRF